MNRRQRTLRWFAGAIAAALAASVHAQFSVTDDTGARVTLASPAQRIVALAPHATELVFAAGAGASIVGVVAGSDYPAGAARLPIVGDAAALDLERIVLLAPDLIVTWPWTVPAQVERLRARGIAVFEADPRTANGIADDIERIGVITGHDAAARAAAAAFRKRLAEATRGHAEMPRLRVFYQVSDVPLFTLGGRHLVSDALLRCGGQNVFSALTIPAPQVNVEAVLAADPQVIVAGTKAAERPAWLDRWRQWPDLDAVRRGALYTVDADLLHRPGPRFVDGVAQLCDALARARQAVR